METGISRSEDHGCGVLIKKIISKISTQRFPTTITPYQYAQHKGKRYILANRTEALVYLAAHELRHLWQAARWSDKKKSASLRMYHGSRGRFSEVDTEAFAITMLLQSNYGGTTSVHKRQLGSQKLRWHREDASLY